MMHQATIYITKTDVDRLGNMIDSAYDQDDRGNLPYVRKLKDELTFAEVVPSLSTVTNTRRTKHNRCTGIHQKYQTPHLIIKRVNFIPNFRILS